MPIINGKPYSGSDLTFSEFGYKQVLPAFINDVGAHLQNVDANAITASERTKLAAAPVSGADIRTMLAAEPNTNIFTDSHLSSLGILPQNMLPNSTFGGTGTHVTGSGRNVKVATNLVAGAFALPTSTIVPAGTTITAGAKFTRSLALSSQLQNIQDLFAAMQQVETTQAEFYCADVILNTAASAAADIQLFPFYRSAVTQTCWIKVISNPSGQNVTIYGDSISPLASWQHVVTVHNGTRLFYFPGGGLNLQYLIALPRVFRGDVSNIVSPNKFFEPSFGEIWQ